MRTSRDTILGKRILLADDEASVRQSIAMLLSVDDHQVSEASNGREALDLFQRGQFDLVITDLAMPEMNGAELALRIKALAPAQPVLMITAHAGTARGDQNPVDGMLTKPFSFTTLREAIADVLS